MWLANLVVQNISKIHNLTLLICHLFMGGSFRSGEILFDPSVFEDLFGTNVDSVCPVHIPWQLIDITRVPSSIRQPNERTDHIFQLIFISSEHPPPDKFIEYFTQYRVFVFLSNDNIEMEKSMTLVRKLSRTLNSNFLSLYCNTVNGSVYVHWNNRNGDRTEINNAFTFPDRIFRRYDEMESITIRVDSLVNEINGRKSHLPIQSQVFQANLLFTSLNVPYVNLTSFQYGNVSLNLTQLVVPKQRKFYKELSLDYEAIGSSKA